jgi:hypothetical protein
MTSSRDSSRRLFLTTALACGSALAPAWATTAPAHPWLPGSRRIGKGTLRVLGLHVYDAGLFALADFDARSFAAHPLVLEVLYQRELTGASIAEYSLKEMRRTAPTTDEATAERWMQFMRRVFPDVKAGDRLVGAWNPATGTSRFAANDAAPLELQDVGFGQHFFGIWLAPTSPRPKLRAQLIGSADKAGPGNNQASPR